MNENNKKYIDQLSEEYLRSFGSEVGKKSADPISPGDTAKAAPPVAGETLRQPSADTAHGSEVPAHVNSASAESPKVLDNTSAKSGIASYIIRLIRRLFGRT